MKISTVLEENEKIFSSRLNIGTNYDLIIKHFVVESRRAVVFFLDGFIREDTLSKFFESLSKVSDDTCPPTASEFLERYVIFGDSRVEDDLDAALTAVLCGNLCLCTEGYDQAVLIDFRESLQRSTTEPEKEKVARGSKDGFVEMLLQNVTLVRRRVRDPHFCTEFLRIGTVTKTDVCICYIADRVDRKLLKIVRKKMREVKTDGLPMSQQTLSNLMMGAARFNPFPKFRYTERPDTTCAQLLHGDVVIFVDNSPFATILPVTFFDIMEDANDYYFPPVTGIYLRIVRYLTALVTTFLTPLWFLALCYPQAVPSALSFIVPQDPGAVPVLLQLLILEISIDGLKLASLNTPTLMSTTMSVLGAVIIGDLAIDTSWFCAESLFYMGFVALSNFSMPSYELSYAFKFSRIILLILTGMFGIWGFAGGVVLMFLMMLFNKTFLGYKFLYPFIPFDPQKIRKKIRKMLGYNDPHDKTA